MKRLAIVMAGIGIFGAAVVASPIIYTESGQVSGTLGATTLTNAAFTFVFTGDTANITGSGVLLNIPTSNSITIGASSGSFTTAVNVGVNTGSGIIGFTDLAKSNGITFTSAGAVGYNLATPISVTASTPFFDQGSLGTSLGTFTITSALNLSFTAITGVPEPASLTFVGAGLLGLMSLLLLRKRA